MNDREKHEVIVVGSGASGTAAASALVDSGVSVLMIDVGFDDPISRALIPDKPFAEIRSSAPDQRRYFLGENMEGVPRGNVRVGAQLTPPRQFITRETDKLAPLRSPNFFPMQSLAIGGLAAGWGAGCQTFSRSELLAMGIDDPDFTGYYNQVAAEIGISGDPSDDASRFSFSGITTHQPAMELDTNAESLLESYVRRRPDMNHRGFYMGKMPLAMLSADLGDRKANPYFDMDFWSDARRSIYRPRYTVERLRQSAHFTYLSGRLVTRLREESPDLVKVDCLDVSAGRHPVSYAAKRVILCAGSLNSARIALGSLGLFGHQTPLLSSPYTYLPCLNGRMLGKPARDRRHSMAQLCAMFAPADNVEDLINVQFYSYRSLLLFKLVKEMPLPPWAGLLMCRLMMTAFTIVGMFHSDRPTSDNWLRIAPATDNGICTLETNYDVQPARARQIRSREAEIIRLLRKLGCYALGRLAPGNGASIHYAGTIPFVEDSSNAFGTDAQDRLVGKQSIFIGDSSPWRYLPGKGLTFTLMANGRRVARRVARTLR